MSFDPDISYNLGQIAAVAAPTYVFSSFAGAAYEEARQRKGVEESPEETYQRLRERESERSGPREAALAFFDLGRKEVLENELEMEPEYSQKY